MALSKAELISKVAEKAGVKTKECTNVVNALLGAIEEELKAGNEISITGFGKFRVRERVARTAINLQTKEKIQVPAKKVPVFHAGKSLKEAVI